jgi:hypothetical protein
VQQLEAAIIFLHVSDLLVPVSNFPAPADAWKLDIVGDDTLAVFTEDKESIL